MTVKPGEVIGPGDTELDFVEVSHLVQGEYQRRPRHSGDELDRILSRYAILLVWGSWPSSSTVSVPTPRAAVAFQAIFGSQSTLVFLGVAALITLSVGGSTCRSPHYGTLSHHGPRARLAAQLERGVGVRLRLALCLVAGAINAFFVIKVGVASMVVTLGTGTLLVGIAEWISSSSEVSINVPAFSKVANLPLLDLPITFYYGLGLVILLAYIRSWTPLGRHMLFVGANREVADASPRCEFNRIPRWRVSLRLAGRRHRRILLVAWTRATSIASGSSGYLLPALAAVFLGTAAVQPGQFNPVGTLIGIFFLETGIFGLELMGYSGWVQDVFYGSGLVIAVAIATVVRVRASRG